MECYLREYYFKPPIGILLLLFLFTMVACQFDNRESSSFKTHLHSPEKLVLESFFNYIHCLSSPDFPLSSFESNSNLFKEPVYQRKMYSDKNVQFFPAILWQIYAINGGNKWKQVAENYSRVIFQGHIVEKGINNDAIPYVYLTRYLADRNQINKSSLLDMLAQYISKNEVSKELKGDSITNSKDCIEQLLDNQLLFFASKETGDPVYAQLALKNSEIVFEDYFQNSHFTELYNVPTNGNTIPDIGVLEHLNSEDLYYLAVIFYGFTILDHQKENERYHLLCIRLADLFSSMLDDSSAKGISSNKDKRLIVAKIDIMSEVLVGLALNKINDGTENKYQEMAENIFNHILNTINQPDEKQNEQYSSKMYFYLFELLKQNQ